MFLTRIGENSRAIITGDLTQIDLPKPGNSGLLHAKNVLQSIPELHFSFFTAGDVVRHPLVKKIVSAYENEKER
jgi:phosphate starvation-inducible PhoH-like protein